MPRYEALVRESVSGPRYRDTLEVFKRICAKIFSTKTRELKEQDFFGARLRTDCDMPYGVDIVFVLHLHDDDVRRRLNEDVVADSIVREMRKHSDLCIRVSLEFARIGWSFLASEAHENDLERLVAIQALDLSSRDHG